MILQVRVCNGEGLAIKSSALQNCAHGAHRQTRKIKFKAAYKMINLLIQAVIASQVGVE